MSSTIPLSAPSRANGLVRQLEPAKFRARMNVRNNMATPYDFRCILKDQNLRHGTRHVHFGLRSHCQANLGIGEGYATSLNMRVQHDFVYFAASPRHIGTPALIDALVLSATNAIIH